MADKVLERLQLSTSPHGWRTCGWAVATAVNASTIAWRVAKKARAKHVVSEWAVATGWRRRFAVPIYARHQSRAAYWCVGAGTDQVALAGLRTPKDARNTHSFRCRVAL